MAFGLKWKRIDPTQGKGDEKAGDEEEQQRGEGEVPSGNQEHGEKVAAGSKTLPV